jgi:nicotinate dehydrogenase subunit B
MTCKIGRRDVLKSAGSLILTVAASGAIEAWLNPQALAQAAAVPPGPPLESIDTWIAIASDGKVTAFTGKVDHGQGLETAFAQIVAEEIDVPVARVHIIMGDTSMTPNQGGASASTGIRSGANPLRNAAAEARRLLAKAGAERLGVPVDAVDTQAGAVFVKADPKRRVPYQQLLKDGKLGATVTWNKQVGNGMSVEGEAKPKPVSSYKIVGQSVPRRDIAAKIFGTEDYVANVRLPNMLHGRMVRPPVAAATPVKVDEASIRHIAGARVVHRQNFLGVAAETEWDALKAAQALKVQWSSPTQEWPGHDGLYEYIRQAPVVASNGQNAFAGKKEFDEAPTNEALARAARVIEAEYECPFQSHARMGPSVGVADVSAGLATIYSDTQKPHFHRQGISKLLGLPEDKVRVIWKHGAGSYGRSDADEAAFEAAVMSQSLGRPVRVQWTREEGIAWDPKAPAAVIALKAGLDAAGNLTAWHFRAKGFSGWDVKWFADTPEQTLAGQLLGHKKWNMHNFDTPIESYQFPAAVAYWQTIAPLQQEASPLRCGHTRAPQEPQTRFAQESFIDEVAAATGRDPLALRLALLKEPREIAVLKAAAEKAGWGEADAKPRPAVGDTLRGRGISLMSGYNTYVAVIAEVEVDRRTGRVWPRRITVAHDCGLVINPSSLTLTIEGNVLQGLSRALHEEVQFDKHRVTSVDWQTYPILDIKDAPEAIDIVVVESKNDRPGGAGEPALVAMPAAVANAIYNATAKRIRRFPMTAARVKQALTA